MKDLICSYITRGGRKLTIKLPLNEYNEILDERYLSDSERRKIWACEQRAKLGERETAFITLH